MGESLERSRVSWASHEGEIREEWVGVALGES